MARAWRYLKENLDTILTIATGAVVAVLGLLNIVGAGVISAVTLAILSLIAFSLLRNRATNDQLQQTIQETRRQLQATLAGMQKRRTSEILFPWGTQTNERNRHFSQAKEIWILSKTCRRLWADSKVHLENVARRGRVRLLFINPNSYALNMIVQTEPISLPEDAKKLKESIEDFMVRLNLAKQKQALDGLEFRLIDYLPAWTLVLINPSKDNRASGGIVYVELATYRPQHGSRPTFTVEYNLEPELFERFCDEFEQMWEAAQKLTA